MPFSSIAGHFITQAIENIECYFYLGVAWCDHVQFQILWIHFGFVRRLKSILYDSNETPNDWLVEKDVSVVTIFSSWTHPVRHSLTTWRTQRPEPYIKRSSTITKRMSILMERKSCFLHMFFADEDLARSFTLTDISSTKSLPLKLLKGYVMLGGPYAVRTAH